MRERQAREIRSLRGEWPYHTNTHTATHTRWRCGPFAVTWVEISQLVTKTSCLSALTVLGVLGASHQLLHCELCWTNVNLLLSFGNFKLKQRREGEYIKNGIKKKAERDPLSGFGFVIREKTRTPEFGLKRAQSSRLGHAPASNWLTGGSLKRELPTEASCWIIVLNYYPPCVKIIKAIGVSWSLGSKNMIVILTGNCGVVLWCISSSVCLPLWDIFGWSVLTVNKVCTERRK